VKVPLTQGQFDALVDFCFNLARESWRLPPAEDLEPRALRRCCRTTAALGPRRLGRNAGLKARREAEKELWNNTAVKQQEAA